MLYKDLTHEQTRQTVDVRQIFETWRAADHDFRGRFAGSMFWRTVNGEGREYLYRQMSKSQRSLGPRSPETERSYAAFKEGQRRAKDLLRATTKRLREMAPVNKALALGRVPTLAARVLRRLDEAGLLDKPLRVIGTHALYAFESLCGVQMASDLLATGDVDLLYDSRAGLKLLAPEIRIAGIMGILRKVDTSFQMISGQEYRAVNRDGFMVDLITPLPRNPIQINKRSRIGQSTDNLTAVEIGGLVWLVSSPSFEHIVIGEDGYPLRMVTPDPRAWAIHKLWLSERSDRDLGKRRRDFLQGTLMVDLLRERRPDFRFDSADLQALPIKLRDRVSDSARSPSDPTDDEADLRPDW